MPRLFLLIMIYSYLNTLGITAQSNEMHYLPITLENVSQLEQIAVLQYDLNENPKAISQLTFDPIQSLLYSQELNETVRIWDMEHMEFVEVLPLPTEYSTSFAINPDGKSMVYGGWDFEQQPDFATLNLWDFEQGENKLIVRDWQFSIEGIQFNQDGSMFAAYGWEHDGQIRAWATEKLDEPILFPGHGDNVYNIAFTSDNRLVTSGEDREIHIWNIETQEIERTIQGYFFVIRPLEPILLASDIETSSGKPNTSIYDLDQEDVAVERSFTGTPVAFTPTGDIVAIAGDIGVWLCNFETGNRLIKLSNYGSEVIAFSPDRRFIATPGDLGIIYIWGIPAD